MEFLQLGRIVKYSRDHPRTAILAGIFLVLGFLAPITTGKYMIDGVLDFFLIYLALAIAYDLLGGFAGYVNLGITVFFGVGAVRLRDPILRRTYEFFGLPDRVCSGLWRTGLSRELPDVQAQGLLFCSGDSVACPLGPVRGSGASTGQVDQRRRREQWHSRELYRVVLCHFSLCDIGNSSRYC